MVAAVCTYERSTRRTGYFREEREEECVVRGIYVSKEALERLGWQKGDEIVVTVDVRPEAR